MSSRPPTASPGQVQASSVGPVIALWLPDLRHWPRGAWSADWAARLGRADRLPLPTDRVAPAVPGFQVLPADFSTAAVSRHGEAADAGQSLWLHAAPCHLRVEPNGLRMLACQAMGLSALEAEDFVAVLRPLLGDLGFELLLSTPERWYLRLADGGSAPRFSPPGDVLGADIGAHLPPGPAGLRWRHLLNEIQISLHPHRRNAERSAGGQLPVNSLWFWGGGGLPNRVQSAHQSVVGTDPLLLGLARLAGVTATATADAASVLGAAANALVDLRSGQDLAALQVQWIEPLAQALVRGRLAAVHLHFAEGPAFALRRRQRLRIWRRALGHGEVD